MPTVSPGDLTLLRTTKHATLLALSVYHPPIIWTARVNGAQADGDTTIVVDGVVQTRAPFKHAQVLIGSTAGARDLGETRFKSYSAPTLNVGAHNAALPDDAYITVIEEIKPAAVHIAVSGSDVVSEDGDVAYSNENVNYMPIARIGPPAVAYIVPATGLATVKFYSSSVAMAGSLSSYAWSFRGGTPNTSAVAGTAGAPVTVTWNTAGEYYVSLTVTDSNGKTHTRYVPVFIYDAPGGATQPYTQIEVSGLSGDVEAGWRATLKVYQAATATEFPDGALCVLSARDFYGDTEISIGGQYTYRENIVFAGYIRNGSVKQNWSSGYVEFQVESISGVMANMWELASKLTTTTGTPAGWHTLQNMTLNLAAHHVLTQHSTITQIADTYFNLLTYAKKNIDLTDAVLSDQLRQFASTPARGRVTSNAQGALYLESNPQLLTLAARAGYTNVLQTTFADLRGELDFGPENQEKQVSRIALSGENANADPVFSLAPPVPWTAGRSEMQDGIRVDTQTEGNEVAGLFDGWRNNKYSDVVLPLRGNYRVFDVAPQENVQANITAAQNQRGIVWTNQRCWVKRVSYDYKPGVLLTTIVVEKDAVPSDGITGVYPIAPPPYPNPPPIGELPPPTPPPTIGPDNLPGKGNLLYVSTHKGLAKCVGAYGTNGTDGTPVWSSMNGSGGGALGNVVIRWFNLDPFSVSGDHFTAGWAMTDGGLWRVTGLPTTPVWAQQLTYAQANTVAGNPEGTLGAGTLAPRFAPSVRKAGFIATQLVYNCGFGNSWNGVGLFGYGNIVFTVYSLDYGATWNCDSTKFLETPGIQLGLDTASGIWIAASYHLDDVYYVGNKDTVSFSRPPATDQTATYSSPQASIMRAPGNRGGAFPDFSAGMADGHSDTGHCYGLMYMPYCNSAGAVYANDNRVYLCGIGLAGQGVNAIQRYDVAFSPLWSNGYTPPTSTPIGNASMPRIYNLFSNMFNEDKAAAIDPSNIWFSSNLSQASPTWTRKTGAGLDLGPRRLSPTYLFCVPCDVNIVFFTGKRSSGGSGVAMPCLTPDFGTTLVDISLVGLAGALDTVMSLVATDMDDSTIIVDYYRP